MVVPAHDPLVRQLAAAQRRDDVVDRRQRPVELRLQADLRRTRAHLVGDRQRATPGFRHDRSTQCGEQGLGVAIGDRQHRDLHDRRRRRPFDSRGVGRCAGAHRQRVAGRHRQVEHTAALHAVLRTPRASGINVALRVAVVARVGVDDAADRALLGRQLGLDAAPRAAITRDDDRAAHRDAAPVEFLVVGRHSVVHVDQRRGDVTFARIRVVRRKLLGALRGRGIVRDDRLFELRHETRWLDQLDPTFLRRREKHAILLDLRVPAVRRELVAQPLGVRPYRRASPRGAAEADSRSIAARSRAGSGMARNVFPSLLATLPRLR